MILEDSYVCIISQHSDLSVVASDDATQLASSLFWDHTGLPTHTQILALYTPAETVFKANAGEKCDVNQNILKAETTTKRWKRPRSTHLGRRE